MKRRTLLSGTTIGVVTGLGGCLDTIDGESTPDEGSTPTTACETGRAVIDAIDEGDYGRAADYSPSELNGSFDTERIRSSYSDFPTPDAIHTVECVEEIEAENFATQLSEALDVEATEAVQLEYALEITIGSADRQTTTHATAVKIDDEWTAWLNDELVPEPNAGVTIERDGSNSATVTVNSIPESVEVFISGDGIDDPSAYRLGDVGETITVSSDDVGSGAFSAVATYASDANVRTEVAQFTLVDPEVWESVDEIVFGGKTSGWVVRTPESIAGLENPTLVLEAGREYRIGWDTGDGAMHNLEIRDENDEVVDGYETELTADPGEEQFLTITASEEMATYRCTPHLTMSGDIEVVESI